MLRQSEKEDPALQSLDWELDLCIEHEDRVVVDVGVDGVACEWETQLEDRLWSLQ